MICVVATHAPSSETTRQENIKTMKTHVLVSRTPNVCGAKAAAEAKRVKRKRIAFIIVRSYGCFVCFSSLSSKEQYKRSPTKKGCER